MDTELLAAWLYRPDVFHTRPNNILCAAHGSKFGEASLLDPGHGRRLVPARHPHWLTTSTIEQHHTFFGYLGVVGALYIASIGVSVMRSSSRKQRTSMSGWASRRLHASW